MNNPETPRSPRRRLAPRRLKPIFDACKMAPDTTWWEDEENVAAGPSSVQPEGAVLVRHAAVTLEEEERPLSVEEEDERPLVVEDARPPSVEEDRPEVEDVEVDDIMHNCSLTTPYGGNIYNICDCAAVAPKKKRTKFPLSPPNTPPAAAAETVSSSCSSSRHHASFDACAGGMMSSLVFDSIKTAVYYLLSQVLEQYRKESCEGCRIGHPSQRRHDCLQEELRDDFFEQYFTGIAQRLFTHKFIFIVQRLLRGRNLCVSDAKIRASAETLLYVLRAEGRFTKSLSDMYDDLVGEDPAKFAELQRMSDMWNRC